MTNLRDLLRPFAPLLLCASALAQGRIVVASDEWTLSSTGYALAPTTDAFVRNLADWFTGGQPGNFRSWSGNFGYTGGELAQTLASEGHTWTISNAGPFDLATLQGYDAIFLGINTFSFDNNVLIQYVQSGGCVYVCGGSGGDALAADTFNSFLSAFGLAFASNYNQLTALVPTPGTHPLLAGVDGLYHNNGNSVSLTANPPAGAQVLVDSVVGGIYAIYDACPDPTVYCTAKLNSQGCVPAIAASGFASASGGQPFQITAANVINTSVGVLIYGYQPGAIPFQGGTLCIGGAVNRTPGQFSGGSATGTDCTGAFSFDFNAWIQGGTDPLIAVAGQKVNAQYWSRDNAASFGSSLTDALQFAVCP